MNLYTSLDLDKFASPEAIKRAYRKRAKKLHPDMPGGSNDEFNNLQRAYLVLSDPLRRQRYDQTGQVDDNKLDPLAAAKELIISAFLQSVNADADGRMFKVDAIANIREHLRGQLAQLDAQKRQAEAKQKVWDKLTDRLKHASPDRSWLHQAFRFHRDGLANVLVEVERQKSVREDALKLLDDYSFEPDSTSTVFTSASGFGFASAWIT